MYLGGSSVGIFVGAAGSAADTGWLDSSDWLAAGGGAVSYGYTSMSGRFYFARSSTGGPIGSFDGGGGFTGYLGMLYRYVQVPTAPTIVSVTPNTDGDAATVVLTDAADNGGSAVTGWRLQRATNAGFTTGVTTINSGSLTVAVTGLTPGVTYYYRAVARNYVSDTDGQLGGPWSATVSQAQPDPIGFGRVWTGSAFVTADARVWSGSAWVLPDMQVQTASGLQQVGV